MIFPRVPYSTLVIVLGITLSAQGQHGPQRNPSFANDKHIRTQRGPPVNPTFLAGGFIPFPASSTGNPKASLISSSSPRPKSTSARFRIEPMERHEARQSSPPVVRAPPPSPVVASTKMSSSPRPPPSKFPPFSAQATAAQTYGGGSVERVPPKSYAQPPPKSFSQQPPHKSYPQPPSAFYAHNGNHRDGNSYRHHHSGEERHGKKGSSYRKPLPPQKISHNSLEEEEYEDSKEEPDRLTTLLQQSNYQCAGKKDGYYADEALNCEVFHYCQAGAKHSWICPNGFAFHQIHLICVPPSADNICKQSNKYHFVNEYLYQPLNEKEASATNTSLVYADRYYPQGYTVGSDMLPAYNPETDNLPAARPPPSYRSRPLLNRHVGTPRHRPHSHHHEHPHGSSPRPNSPQSGRIGDPRSPGPGVFYSPESINIPLSHRRPPPRSSPSPRPNYPRPSPKYDESEYEDY